MALKGLVIRQPWIGMILRGEKIWEMRSQPCRHRGELALIEKGSGKVVGLARIVDDLAPCSEAELRATISKHGIPLNQIPDAVSKGWVRPWVLADIVSLSRPVPYAHTSGGSWVNLTESEEAAVRDVVSCMGFDYRHAFLSPAKSIKQLHEEELHQRPSGHSEGAKKRQRPSQNVTRVNQSKWDSDFSVSVKEYGSELVIDISLDDAPRKKPKSRRSGRWEGVGAIAVLVTFICILAFSVHFVLGIFSSSISALNAFKWLIPLIVSSVIAEMVWPGSLIHDSAGRS